MKAWSALGGAAAEWFEASVRSFLSGRGDWYPGKSLGDWTMQRWQGQRYWRHSSGWWHSEPS